MGIFYTFVEDEDYSNVHMEEKSTVGTPDAYNYDEMESSEGGDSDEGGEFINILQEFIINITNKQIVDNFLKKGNMMKKKNKAETEFRSRCFGYVFHRTTEAKRTYSSCHRVVNYTEGIHPYYFWQVFNPDTNTGEGS